nr:hypothetical protein [Angustibacter aerolatus]
MTTTGTIGRSATSAAAGAALVLAGLEVGGSARHAVGALLTSDAAGADPVATLTTLAAAVVGVVLLRLGLWALLLSAALVQQLVRGSDPRGRRGAGGEGRAARLVLATAPRAVRPLAAGVLGISLLAGAATSASAGAPGPVDRAGGRLRDHLRRDDGSRPGGPAGRGPGAVHAARTGVGRPEPATATPGACRHPCWSRRSRPDRRRERIRPPWWCGAGTRCGRWPLATWVAAPTTSRCCTPGRAGGTPTAT